MSTKIGVLFVHGIGTQERGGTLAGFGGPLIESTERWLVGGSVSRTPPVDLPDSPVYENVTVTDADGRTLEILAAESCWADTVTIPSHGTLLRWLCSTVPFLVTRAFDTGLRRTNRQIERNLDRPENRRARPKSFRGALWVFGLAPVRLVQNAIALVASLGVLTLLLMLGLVGLGRFLTAYIGDSYAYLTDADAMIERVRHDLDWLEWHANAPLVIVAHSQGAEIVRRVLIGRSSPIASLVTLGSGIEKLDAVRRLRDDPRRGRLAIAVRAVSALALGGAIQGIAKPWAWWLVVVLLALSFAALSEARELMRRIVGNDYDHEQLRIGPGQVSRWTDVYATSDPVSEGDLPVGGLGTSEQIVNRRFLLLDHVWYWENVERFRANVALEIARVGGWIDLAELPPDVVAATARRVARVWVLVAARWVVVLAAVLFASVLTSVAAVIALVAVELAWGLWSSDRTKAEYPPPAVVTLVAK